MDAKGDEGEHGRKEETGHSVDGHHGVEPWDLVHQNSSAEKGGQLIDNSEYDDLDEEITVYWSDPEFVKLVNDEGFRIDVRHACAAVISSFKPSPVYTCDDLEQDVIARFGKWFPKYRGDAQPKTLLRRIAFNQLVDVYRKRDKQCSSYDDIETECLELLSINSATNRNHVAAKQERKILLGELTAGLTPKERAVFGDYFELGMTTPEIAKARGVSKQAVSKQLTRIVTKLKSAVDRPTLPGGGDPVPVGIGRRRPM